MLLLVPFLKNLYRGFSKKSDAEDFDVWYADLRKKYLDKSYDSAKNPSEELFAEAISASDLSHLDSQMKLLFMRNYNRVKARNTTIFMTLAKGFREHALLRWACGLFVVLACCAAAYVYLSVAHVQVTVSIASKSFQKTIQIPLSVPLAAFFQNRESFGQAQGDANNSSSPHPSGMSLKNPADTAFIRPVAAGKHPFPLSSSSVQPDSIPKTVKKAFIAHKDTLTTLKPELNAASGPAGLPRAAKSIPSQKVLPDTATVTR